MLEIGKVYKHKTRFPNTFYLCIEMSEYSVDRELIVIESAPSDRDPSDFVVPSITNWLEGGLDNDFELYADSLASFYEARNALEPIKPKPEFKVGCVVRFPDEDDVNPYRVIVSEDSRRYCAIDLAGRVQCGHKTSIKKVIDSYGYQFVAPSLDAFYAMKSRGEIS